MIGKLQHSYFTFLCVRNWLWCGKLDTIPDEKTNSQFTIVLHQIACHFMGLAFHYDYEILFMKCLAVSLSDSGVIQSLPGWGKSTVFLCVSNYYFITRSLTKRWSSFSTFWLSLYSKKELCTEMFSSLLNILYIITSFFPSHFHIAAISVSWHTQKCTVFLYTSWHMCFFAKLGNCHNDFTVKCENKL